MWRFKPFMHKEQTGLEGRSIDIGNLKIHVQKAIAEGGFSCVYLARDALHVSKQYALKHIICNDEESLELVTKEISVMKSLRGHPNVVTLYAYTFLDMGRTKEALLLMEFCEKSLVHVLESRGAGYFDEKQVLSIFRDVCNAVFAMHCQSPPIAHRDLKAENVLLGSDGLWKLCDFGSTSINHKRFEKPEEMGIEEDNIRKYTTPAYRAPELWDLFRRELINEKVDIWALGCLLFRICYFKSAFDGDSKLQILNGNYRIPDFPKYSPSVSKLIRDMLQISPDERPDVTQVWFRVNEQLPIVLQKSLPDQPPEMRSTDTDGGTSKPSKKTPSILRRSPQPLPSSGEQIRNSSQVSHMPCARDGGQLGAFWSTQHAKESLVEKEETGPIFDEESTVHSTSQHDRIGPDNHPLPKNTSPVKDENARFQATHNSKSHKPEVSSSKDFELPFFQSDSESNSKCPKASKTENTTFKDKGYSSFVAEFDTNKFSSGISSSKSGKEEALEAEIERLKEQLKQAKVEKSEITSKFEKLSAICRSQRQEIQELNQALASRNPSPSKEAFRNQTLPGLQHSPTPTPTPQQKEKVAGRDWELQQEKSNKSTSSTEPKQWQAFAEEPKSLQQSSSPMDKTVKSVRSRNLHKNKQAANVNASSDSWGFESESFTAVPAGNSPFSRPVNEGNNSQRFGEAKIMENKSASQPAGWAGF